MMNPALRKFSVHARHEDCRKAVVVEDVSFDSAALSYLEELPPILHRDEHEVSVIVRELGGGREHCFRIDLHSGDTAPCEGK